MLSAFKLLEWIHFLGTETLHSISVTDFNYADGIIALYCVLPSIYIGNNKVEILFICLVAIPIASFEKVWSSLPQIFATELCLCLLDPSLCEDICITNIFSTLWLILMMIVPNCKVFQCSMFSIHIYLHNPERIYVYGIWQLLRFCIFHYSSTIY